MISIIFFGSFQDYSVITLDLLAKSSQIKILAVVTTPPAKGDRLKLQKTAVQEYCEANNLKVYPLESLDTIPPDLDRPDFIVVCGYGKKIPAIWLNFPRVMAVNIHQSLLPEYAGRFPAEWAILNGETRTGVTMIRMSDKFDAGGILAKMEITLTPTSTRDEVYQKLYRLAADLALATLPQIAAGQITSVPQTKKGFYARQITREDGFVDPKSLTDSSFAATLDRKLRALSPWPGVWTYVHDLSGKKLLMKIISAKIFSGKLELQNVQIEGKKPTFWQEIKNYYTLS